LNNSIIIKLRVELILGLTCKQIACIAPKSHKSWFGSEVGHVLKTRLGHA